jgi:hypothetical protein
MKTISVIWIILAIFMIIVNIITGNILSSFALGIQIVGICMLSFTNTKIPSFWLGLVWGGFVIIILNLLLKTI